MSFAMPSVLCTMRLLGRALRRYAAAQAVSQPASRSLSTVPASSADRLRACVSLCVLLAWHATQLWGDFDHLTGRTPADKHHNMFWPMPELSMYASPITHPQYGLAAALTMGTAVACLFRLRRALARPPAIHRTEKSFG